MESTGQASFASSTKQLAARGSAMPVMFLLTEWEECSLLSESSSLRPVITRFWGMREETGPVCSGWEGGAAQS